jgi:hypothetical protein
VRVSRSAVACAIVPLVLGCPSSADVARFPTTAEAISLLLIRQAGTEPPTALAIAYDSESDHPRYITFRPRQDVDETIFAVEYRCSLSALGFARGPVTVASEGTQIPPSSLVQEAHAHGGQISSWSQSSSGSPTLASLRLVVPMPGASCTVFSVQQAALPNTAGVRGSWNVALDGDDGLAVLIDGRAFISHAGGTWAPAGSTSPDYDVGWRDPSGQIWVAGLGGAFARLGPDLQPIAGPTRTSTRGTYQALTGAGPGQPFELYLASDDGVFERFDGTSWTQLSVGLRDPVATGVGVAWVGPGDAISVGTHGTDVAHYKNGIVVRESIGLTPGSDAPVSAVRVEGLGIAVGTAHGALYLGAGGAWTQIAPPSIAQDPARILVPLSQGVLFGGHFGFMGEWRKGFQMPCAPVQWTAGSSVDSGASLAHDLMLVSDDSSATYLVRLVPPRAACPNP